MQRKRAYNEQTNNCSCATRSISILTEVAIFLQPPPEPVKKQVMKFAFSNISFRFLRDEMRLANLILKLLHLCTGDGVRH